ncbi:MAG: SDR family NAD(P)-dependent oxidoreductase, partial [Flavobacteriales bacterium]
MKQVAWITGGSRGIGLATVKEFLQKDWKVIVLTRNLDPLSELKEEHGSNLELVAYDLQNPMQTNLPSD